MSSAPPVAHWPTTFLVDDGRLELPDPVVVEEPLEISLAGDDEPPARLAVTLRTPGHDGELAAGLLYAEGIVGGHEEIAALEPRSGGNGTPAGLVVRLARSTRRLRGVAGRPFLSTAACGACGKAAIDTVFASGFPPLPAGPRIAAELLQALPDRMRAAQPVFAETGGLHAAALFSPTGDLLLLREDIGRHNAVDKVIGALLLARALPAGERVLVASGRAGFEIVQKALRAGFPILAAVGAPSTLALRLAARAGMTLAGFVRAGRCNLYCGAERVT